jgi:hypothetical protein
MSVKGGPNIVTSGLVLELDAGNIKSYPGTGTTWFDKSGNANNGTLINGPTFNTGSLGSIVFDGVDDYVDCGNPLSLQITGSLTLGIWMKASTSSAIGSLINKSIEIFGNSNQKVYELGFLNGNMYFQLGNGTTVASLFYSSTPVVNNAWHYIICTWDGTTGTNSMKMYYDGSLVIQGDSTISTIQNVVFTLQIGNGRRFPYTGNASITQIYNRALSADEVLQNFNATKGRFGL